MRWKFWEMKSLLGVDPDTIIHLTDIDSVRREIKHYRKTGVERSTYWGIPETRRAFAELIDHLDKKGLLWELEEK